MIPTDVEALVLDPSYRGTDLDMMAPDLGVAVEWHEGRALRVSELERHPDFRGPRIIEVGRRIAQDGRLDARIVGVAALIIRRGPQDLKKVGHHIARFGTPF